MTNESMGPRSTPRGPESVQVMPGIVRGVIRRWALEVFRRSRECPIDTYECLGSYRKVTEASKRFQRLLEYSRGPLVGRLPSLGEQGSTNGPSCLVPRCLGGQGNPGEDSSSMTPHPWVQRTLLVGLHLLGSTDPSPLHLYMGEGEHQRDRKSLSRPTPYRPLSLSNLEWFATPLPLDFQ